MGKNPFYEMDLEEKRLRREAKKNHKREAKRRVETRGANSSSVLRLFIVGIVILLHIVLLVLAVLYIQGVGEGVVNVEENEQVAFLQFLFALVQLTAVMAYVVLRILAVFIVLALFARTWNSAFKLPWIIFILLSPVVGLILYLLLGRKGTISRRERRKYARIRDKIWPNYIQKPGVIDEYKNSDPELYHQLYYLNKEAGYTAFKNTDVTYYREGKHGLDAQILELRKAKKFIFFEYHAIENQVAFEKIKRVLFEKAAEGVEVRVFYDDMGSIGFINHKFRKEMIEHGVKCRVFNPLKPFMITFMNNRDHRKITVIDGKVGFTGGYNIADEYFDITHPYGDWIDTGIKLEGEAVNSLSLIFLENWNAIKETDSIEDIKNYLIDYSSYKAKEPKGVILPYADGPVDGVPLAETAYMNLIRDAKHYIYITTPYLIITDEMTRELIDAAKRGIDVRIITPGIPDKAIVYKMTRSYYMNLAKAGIKICEYKYGFVHSKMMLVDDHMAIIGTINLDYRSLYHHFENACFFSEYRCLYEVRKTFDYLLERSRDVTEKHARKRRLSAIEVILRLFAPLM